MHQVPDAVKPVYVTGPAPLQFHEIYTPRSEIKLIYKGEKSYWRTRDRIGFSIFEDRENRVMIITSRNIDSNEIYRTIFLNLPLLYFELEAKARGDRELLTKKKDKKLDETGIIKAATDYIISRLNIVADPLPWPTFDENGFVVLESEMNTNIITTTATIDNSTTTPPPVENPVINSSDKQKERMITFSKLTNDLSNLEISKPPNLSFESLQGVEKSLIKLNPIVNNITNVEVNDDKNININNQISTDSNNNNSTTKNNTQSTNDVNNNTLTHNNSNNDTNSSNSNVADKSKQLSTITSKNNNTKSKPTVNNGKTSTPNKVNNNNSKVAPSG